jgi:hypothetical protein
MQFCIDFGHDCHALLGRVVRVLLRDREDTLRVDELRHR